MRREDVELILSFGGFCVSIIVLVTFLGIAWDYFYGPLVKPAEEIGFALIGILLGIALIIFSLKDLISAMKRLPP